MHLTHDPGLQPLLFGCRLCHLFNQRTGNHDGAIFIDHDHIIGKDRYPATANRLLPIDKGKTGD